MTASGPPWPGGHPGGVALSGGAASGMPLPGGSVHPGGGATPGTAKASRLLTPDGAPGGWKAPGDGGPVGVPACGTRPRAVLKYDG